MLHQFVATISPDYSLMRTGGIRHNLFFLDDGDTGKYYRLIALFGFDIISSLFSTLTLIYRGWTARAWGSDVFQANPCDPETGLPMNYTPLWLWGTLTGLAFGQPPLSGWLMGVCFLLALAVLPPPRSRLELVIRLAATLSPAVTFALERANAE